MLENGCSRLRRFQPSRIGWVRRKRNPNGPCGLGSAALHLTYGLIHEVGHKVGYSDGDIEPIEFREG